MGRMERGKGTSLMVVSNQNEVERREKPSPYEARKLRYAMPLQAMDNVQTAGVVASSRLLDMLTDEATWSSMRNSDRLRLIELSMVQAFGRVDSGLQEEKLKAVDDPNQKSDHRAVLLELQQRLELPELKKDKS